MQYLCLVALLGDRYSSRDDRSRDRGDRDRDSYGGRGDRDRDYPSRGTVFLLYFSGEHKHSFYRKVIDRGAREDRGRDRPSRWGDDRERGPPGGGDGFRGG